MVKLIAYYKAPQDKQDFEQKYFNEHLPLAKKMPGLTRAEVCKLEGVGGGESEYFMQTDMYFDDDESLKAAMMSDEGKAAAKNLMSFAKGLVSMSVARIVE